MQPVILHISNDFPDPMVPDKTRAVVNLVEATPEFRHVVYSLNRVDGWSGLTSLPFGPDRTAVAYYALPKGLLWEGRLQSVAEWIEADLKAKGIVPDLVEAHKFTVEGLVGEYLADRFGKPLVCDIQGDTDTKILKTKAGLRGRYRAIAQKAALVFPFAHWPLPVFRDLIGLEDSKCRVLPVLPGIDTLAPSPVSAANRLLTVFNLDSWQRKNLSGTMAAMARLKAEFPDICLDVYGRGSPKSVLGMRKAIDGSGIAERVRVMGPAPNGRLPDIMKDYAAFVMPTKRESYGLVFAEALFAGLPLVFSKQRGIDGFFETSRIGYAADPFDSADIAAGIAQVLRRQAQLKESVASMQASGELDVIRKSGITQTYRQELLRVLQR